MLEWPEAAAISASDYIRRANNCDRFRSDLGYLESLEDTADEERRFPIAFSLLTYENLEQTERLLRLIYRPQNVYCIHVDAKASSDELRTVLKHFKLFFTARCTIVQSAVLQLHVVCLYVCLGCWWIRTT